ncbi:Protein of unknown function DUF1376 [uncultured Caudovirales phage]|uniref:Lin1244/Lin1753-like N-terminal domain-containing protein n=1 Tax=uncultured Caudovirales phage TaxID=2100421 RepID=A0A6J5LQ72_9CAUD|nr:Protein of unknown function DUF1376 [uncultured Caudovirales phage]
MHYYQFNIGDYASHTQRLSLMEDLAYRRLLDEYYLHERPFNSGITSVARQIGMREFEAEVQFVLECFFQFSEELGWVNKRADEEILHFRSKIEQASRAGRLSAERRLNAGSTDVQLTNNHKPITNKQIKNTVATPDGVSDSVWQDFVKLRKQKKAAITETAIRGIEREARKAGVTLQTAIETCCERGWAGFKADWMQSAKPAPNLSAARTIFGDERIFNETLKIA